MTVYIDTSVVIRRLLGQRNAIADWGAWDEAYSSVICRTEYARTLDRLRLEGGITDDQRVSAQEQFDTFWSSIHRIRLSDEVLERAGQSFPTVIGTLDAVHVASVLVLQARGLAKVDRLLTHDEQLGRAARALGFQVGGM
jgi:predicted nucleic acid-binding protein